MNRFAQIEGSGLLQDDYLDENEAGDKLSETLKKRREKLAQTKIGLQPDAEDSQDD